MASNITDDGKVYSFHNNQIFLYGYNQYSSEHFTLLKERGYQICAIIDRRAGQLQSPERKVITREHFLLENQEKKDQCLIIIMLQNALQHEKIALELLDAGYRKCIFVPMRGSFEASLENKLRDIYNLFINRQYASITAIPCLAGKEKEYDPSCSVIKKEGDIYNVWMPAELVYTNPKRLTFKSRGIEEYADVPILSYRPYRDLFLFLEGGGRESAASRYLMDYGKNSCLYQNSLTDTNVLDQRHELLFVYRERLNEGMDFFITSAPMAEFNGRAFNLLEGQHRSIFLAMQGFRFLPLRITVQDWMKWRSGFSEQLPELYAAQGRSADFPVLLPQFKMQSAAAGFTGCVLWRQLCMSYDADLFAGQRVLDLSSTFGYFARNAVRCHAKEAYVFCKESELPCVSAVNLAEGCSEVRAGDRPAGRFELVFAGTREDQDISLSDIRHRYGCRFLFAELPAGQDREKTAAESGFQKYASVGKIYHNGKLRENIVFMQ